MSPSPGSVSSFSPLPSLPPAPFPPLPSPVPLFFFSVALLLVASLGARVYRLLPGSI
ncbi:hypothetical protein BV20DRAFT_974058 [Pilatotrama ljubarskyi]|nr:hypothetical protein BV20DRAFT_974058 [Pilatotrama ljubarskyi]